MVCTVRCCCDQWLMIFENLFVNIQKYAMPQSRVYVQVHTSGEAPEEFVEITIKNMSATELNFDPEEITERFVRGDTSRGTEGSGLGLAIVKHIAVKHNAQITLESELGRGTTISVTFDRCFKA